MLQSKLFTKTRKEAPTDEVSKNAQLLIRGGFIHKDMAGVYTYLPLGLRVSIRLKYNKRRNEYYWWTRNTALRPFKTNIGKQVVDGDDVVVDNWFKTEL